MSGGTPVCGAPIQSLTVEWKAVRRSALMSRFIMAAPGVLLLYWCLQGLAKLAGVGGIPAGNLQGRVDLLFFLVMLYVATPMLWAATQMLISLTADRPIGVVEACAGVLDGAICGVLVPMAAEAAVQLAVGGKAAGSTGEAQVIPIPGILVDDGQSKYFIVGRGGYRGRFWVVRAVVGNASPAKGVCWVAAMATASMGNPGWRSYGAYALATPFFVFWYQSLPYASGPLQQAVSAGVAFLGWVAVVAWFCRPGPARERLSEFLRRAAAAAAPADANQANAGAGVPSTDGPTPPGD